LNQLLAKTTEADIPLIQGGKSAYSVACSPPTLATGCDESNDGEVLVNACWLLYYKRVQMSKADRAEKFWPL
jgi:hypothetical protein